MIFGIDTIKRALALVELVEDVEEGLRIGKILAQVFHSSLLTSLLEVVVDPSDQNGFWGKLLDVLQLLTLLGKTPDLRGLLEGDELGDNESKGLPDEGKDKMRCLLDEILGRNTDQFNSATLSSSQTHLKILVDLVDIHVSLGIDGGGEDAVLIDLEHELVDEDTIVKHME